MDEGDDQKSQAKDRHGLRLVPPLPKRLDLVAFLALGVAKGDVIIRNKITGKEIEIRGGGTER